MLASWGFYDDAVSEAEKAVALDENDATALAGLADALIKADRPAEGLDHIEQAMRLDPHYPPSYLIILGAAQFGMENFGDAAATFERAVKRNPDNEIPYIYLASAYGHLGRIKEADDAIEAANEVLAKQGKGDLVLKGKSDAYSLSQFEKIDLGFFGTKPIQSLVRTGLSDIPALIWQDRITVHIVLSSGEGDETWYEVEGATQIDIRKAESLHEEGAVFIDTSHPDVWRKQHIPGAVHLYYGRIDDPTVPRLTEESLSAVASKSTPIVVYCKDTGCSTGAWEAAKAAAWGFQEIYFMRGGAQAWMDAGYPVETGQ
jgi:rhodanese-related sulfurtransferase